MKRINRLQQLTESTNAFVTIHKEDLGALLVVYEVAPQARIVANRALDEKTPDFYSSVDDISYILDSCHEYFAHLS